MIARTMVDFRYSEESLESALAVRGGGHNVGGRALCDDGIVIDLSRMHSVYVGSGQSNRSRTGRRDPW